MSRRDTTPFQKTRLALAVAALSASLGACSTVPREEGVGGTIADAGRATAETGSRLWDRTLYLLGFGESVEDTSEPRLAGARDERLLDEVDLAMMKEDAVMPSPGAAEAVDSPAWSEVVAEPGTGELVEEGLVEEEMPAVAGNALTHEVGASETLWDIAKRTTGDATNWHVLADVNDLAPDASVYPGQTIVVPPDLVRPELVGFATTAEAEAAGGGAAPGSSGDATALELAGNATGERLAIPGAPADGALAPTEAERLAAEVRAEVDAASGGTVLRLGAGETLWDFSKRTTGDATNWRAIAEANGFSEEKATKVYENMRITVPTALLRDELVEANDASGEIEPEGTIDEAVALENVEPRDELVPIADASDVSRPGAPSGDEPVPLAAADESDDSQAIRIVEATYRSESDELVTDAAAEAAAGATAIAAESAATTVASNGAPEEIMVSGTYYPKAVYNDADFSSSLLMRVSPGTTLQVSRAVGPWYEVATDQGTGYVHARDIK